MTAAATKTKTEYSKLLVTSEITITNSEHFVSATHIHEGLLSLTALCAACET